MDELKKAVLRQKSGRAPGEDGLKAELIKHALSRIQIILLDVINTILYECNFPKIWEHGIVKIFLKEGKKDKSLIKPDRPITLLPVFSKITE